MDKGPGSEDWETEEDERMKGKEEIINYPKSKT